MKVQFFTLGCKTNQYETNAMEQKFIESGYEVIRNTKNNDMKDNQNNDFNNQENVEIADIYVINTCSVTNIAERKSRQFIRRAKELNKDSIVIACGCYAQVAKSEIEKIFEVDIVLGINEKNNIVEIVNNFIIEKNINKKDYEKIESKINFDSSLKENKDNTEKEETIVSDVMHQNEYKDFGTTTYTEENRAIIKIQDGCDRFCTYCIIPYARGKVRSREPNNILEEIKKNTDEGTKEIVLTGIHIASYGKDFSKEETAKFRKNYGYSKNYKPFDPKQDLSSGGFRLIELLEQINKIEKVQRIRIGSLEPKLITPEFVERLSKLEKICNHFHLSLQSGCDDTLKRMNRRYNTDEFTSSVKTLIENFENLNLTTDVIVGFPGETEEEFETTYKFLKKIKFYKMHIFKYSPKRGTAAEKMPNQIDGKTKEIRSQKLIKLSEENQLEYNKSYIGSQVSVLFENKDGEYFKGHTSNYLLVKVKSDKDLKNEICNVIINNVDELDLIGSII